MLFRGGATYSPHHALWDDAYLREHFGHLPIEVEYGKKENRSDPQWVLPMRDFLDVYQRDDLYCVVNLPAEMLADVALPPVLACDAYKPVASQLFWSIFLWRRFFCVCGPRPRTAAPTRQ